MGIPGGANLLLAAGGVSAYELDQSLRFGGVASQYLRRNANTGTAATSGTISVWLKKATTYTSTSYAQTLFAGEGASYLTLIDFPGTSSTSTSQLNIYTVAGGRKSSTAGFRDPGAWFHLVITMTNVNSSSSTATVYINGVQDSQLTGNQYPKFWGDGSAIPLTIGNYASAGAGSAFHGYMAEFHSVQNQTLGPTNFGEFDDNGVWRPIEVSGITYGSNGFYLKFDPSATNGIGHDHSGNGNNFTATGFTTSGTGTDVLSDTPTNNFATLNPLARNTSGTALNTLVNRLHDGNLQWKKLNESANGPAISTIGVSSGKWYWEATLDYSTGAYTPAAGVTIQRNNEGGNAQCSVFGTSDDNYQLSGFSNSGSISYVPSTGDRLLCSLDLDSATKTLSVEIRRSGGSSIGTLTGNIPSGDYLWHPGLTVATTNAEIWQTINFGQRAFEYTAPSGYKALSTSNLPAPDIADGSDYFNAVLYTGNSTTNAVNGVGFQPDLVWIKSRSHASDHALYDSTRGVNKELRSNAQDTQYTFTDSLNSFTSNGFSLGSDTGNGNVNLSGRTYVTWCWDKSATPGFNIVSWSGNDVNGRSIAHGLGKAPELIIVKAYSYSSTAWPVWHGDLNAIDFLVLNGTAAKQTASAYFGGGANEQAPDSTNFYIGSNNDVNGNPRDYIAYVWTSVPGYSKFGSFTGNGATDGPFVATSFTPAFLIWKRTDSTANWFMVDAARNTYNPVDKEFYPDQPNTENTFTDVDFLSNGFKLRASAADRNANGGTFIYMCFASNPFGGDGVSPATAR